MNKPYDYVNAIIAFENGELDEAQTIELFQYLVDSGMAWSLQGRYGRQAHEMLKAGLISGKNLILGPNPKFNL